MPPIPTRTHTLAEMDHAWRLFPNVGRSGCYRWLLQTIYVGTTTRQLSKARKGDLATGVECYPILAHEACHWYDHVATSWGREQLGHLCRALNARDRNEPEEFWHVRQMHISASRTHFPRYFSVVNPEVQVDDKRPPWQYAFTAGSRFDADGALATDFPITFTTFHSPSRAVARVPFSVASLLEVNALAAEMRTLQVLLPNDNLQDFRRQILKVLYAPEMGVYSVALHATANKLDLFDILQSLEYASVLGSYCLNVPSSLITGELRIPNEMRAWGEKNARALDQKDRGFLFLMLLHSRRPQPNQAPSAWLSEACRAVGLPVPDEIAPEDAWPQVDLGRKGRFTKEFIELLDGGLKVARRRGVCGTGMGYDFARWDEMNLPPIFSHDGSLLNSWEYTRADLQARIDARLTLSRDMNEFVEACGT